MVYRNYLLITCLLFITFITKAQHTEVMTLGTFHFAFPNQDVVKISHEDQIDILDAKHQREIDEIIKRLKAFAPTIIVIENSSSKQAKTDSLFKQYSEGNYKLGRNETEQLGFRIAKEMGISGVYCADEWGRHYSDSYDLLSRTDTLASEKFFDYFYNHPDTAISYNEDGVFKTRGILAELRRINDPKHLTRDFGNYLTGVFKYETDSNQYMGVDFTSGWWFNRNLRIFRNIQNIESNSDDRILVIFGSGHLNILNILFEASPEFKLISPLKYLE